MMYPTEPATVSTIPSAVIWFGKRRLYAAERTHTETAVVAVASPIGFHSRTCSTISYVPDAATTLQSTAGARKSELGSWEIWESLFCMYQFISDKVYLSIHKP